MGSKAVIFVLLAFAGTTYSQNSSAPPEVPKITLGNVGSDYVEVSWPRTGAWENVEDFDITVNSSDTENVCSSNVTCKTKQCTFNATQEDSCKISSCTALNITVEGDGSSSDLLNVVTAPPSAETISATTGSSKIATCAWALPTDNVSCLNNTRIIFKSENAVYTYNEAGVISNKTHSLHACDVGLISCTIQTFGGDGESDVKYSNNANFTEKNAGSLIEILTLTPGTFMLNTSWDLTTDNCTRLTGYRISWNPGNTTGFVISNTTKKYSIDNLTPCTEYNVTLQPLTDVQANLAEGNSAINATELTVLMSPSDVTEENVTTDSITVSWSQVEWGPLCLVQNYTVSWNSMERPNDSGSETTTNDTITIAGLSACTSYNITIEAWNSEGPSEPAYHENRTMAIAPGPPVNVICRNADSPSEFNVSWSEPNKTNCVKGYIVKYTGDVLWSDTEDQNEMSTVDTAVNLVGLTPWTIYNVSVAGDIGGEEFGEFETCEMETQEDTPGPPRFLNRTYSDASSITLEWDRPIEENGNLLGYTLTWGPSNYRNFTANDTMAVITSLDRRTSYNVTLWAITKVGLGQSISVIVSTGGANVAAIVVPIIFGLILLILVIIAYLKKAKMQDFYKNMTQKRSGMKDGRNNTEMSQRQRPPPPPPPGPPAIDVEGVKKERLRQFINELEYNSHEGLEEEFNLLKEMSPQHPTDTANEYYNRPKNRFINILPYNDSRVILSEVQGSPGSDYINASYIWDAEGRRSFIAAQGPKVNTTADFWRMVWELNVYYIVMLTNLMEKGRDKCFKYWPDPEEGPVTHGAYSIQNHNEDKAIFSTNRLLEIQSGGHKRTVKHYHFTSWPDFGVPQHEDQLLDFISKIRTNVISSNKPMVVHCSAGVGRTGTFIALWNLMENVDRTPNASEVNINKTILQMRECRPLMVQSQDQYLYLCKCIATYIENPGRWNGRDEVDNSYENAGYGDEGNIYENVYMKS